jgi:hypothetical protein
MTRIGYWDDLGSELSNLLVGRSIVEAEGANLTLDDGTVLEFDKDNSDCCSYIELVNSRSTNSIITAVKVEDDEGEYGEGAYHAWIRVLTEADPYGINIVEADGDASNGYYLHGFALGVTVTKEGAT